MSEMLNQLDAHKENSDMAGYSEHMDRYLHKDRTLKDAKLLCSHQ